MNLKTWKFHLRIDERKEKKKKWCDQCNWIKLSYVKAFVWVKLAEKCFKAKRFDSAMFQSMSVVVVEKTQGKPENMNRFLYFNSIVKQNRENRKGFHWSGVSLSSSFLASHQSWVYVGTKLWWLCSFDPFQISFSIRKQLLITIQEARVVNGAQTAGSEKLILYFRKIESFDKKFHWKKCDARRHKVTVLDVILGLNEFSRVETIEGENKIDFTSVASFAENL